MSGASQSGSSASASARQYAGNDLPPVSPVNPEVAACGQQDRIVRRLGQADKTLSFGLRDQRLWQSDVKVFIVEVYYIVGTRAIRELAVQAQR
jgi:hypothetical protein